MSLITELEGGMEDWVDSIMKFAPERAIWLGWSLGGMLALQATKQCPRRVQGLIMCSSSPCFIQKRKWPHAVNLGVLNEFRSSLREDKSGVIKRFLSLQTLGSEKALYVRRFLQQVVEAVPLPNEKMLHNGLRLLMEYNLTDAFRNISCPAMMILGSEDKLVPVMVEQNLKDLNHAVKIVRISGGGHAPFISHPQPFVAAVTMLFQ